MRNKYKIITCASFGSSGSGVVTDFLNEFSSIKNLGDSEFRFLQDYDGVSTLEDALIFSPHRLNSDIAIQNFKRYVNRQCGSFINRRYEKFFNGKWKEISYQFIDKLVDACWKGYWEQYQIMATSKFFAFFKYQFLPRMMKLLNGNKKYIAYYLPKRDMYFSYPSEEFFVNCVREYINDLLDAVHIDGKFQYVYLDQLMPPANISKYERYFDSIKTIVVDRDPRDYYIENVLRYGEGWVPKSVDKFAIVYRKLREQAASYMDSENVLRIKFEDTIFKYQDFSNRLITFLNLNEEDHIDKFKYFDPSKSVRNTQLWKSQDIDIKLTQRIEELLPEYLYNFDEI